MAGEITPDSRATSPGIRIAQTLLDITAPTPRNWALNKDGEEFAGRAVAPTFLAAGAGLFIGDLSTAGAILRPDYATGIGLAASLETAVFISNFGTSMVYNNTMRSLGTTRDPVAEWPGASSIRERRARGYAMGTVS